MTKLIIWFLAYIVLQNLLFLLYFLIHLFIRHTHSSTLSLLFNNLNISPLQRIKQSYRYNLIVIRDSNSTWQPSKAYSYTFKCCNTVPKLHCFWNYSKIDKYLLKGHRIFMLKLFLLILMKWIKSNFTSFEISLYFPLTW